LTVALLENIPTFFFDVLFVDYPSIPPNSISRSAPKFTKSVKKKQIISHLVLGLVVELVGEPGEVVADLLAHGDGDLLALAVHGQHPLLVDKDHPKKNPKNCCRPHYFRPQLEVMTGAMKKLD
jgi:hypothetical protein